jgi:hypothetical protein
MRIVGGELVMPLAPAGVGIESDHGTGEEVVTFANIAVDVGARVAHGPEQRVQLGIEGAGEPGGAAPLLPTIAVPSVVSEFTGAGDGVEAP